MEPRFPNEVGDVSPSTPLGMKYIPLTDPVVVDLLFPSVLYDADGILIEGKHHAVNLVSGTVWHVIGYDDKMNAITEAKKHKAPLTLRSLQWETVLSGKPKDGK